jgi:tRNA threonylcarbamoyladenosine biosynthesis protein TsaE
MEFITKSPEETKRAGQEFADSLIEGSRNFATVGLIGDLGAGKTTFVQGFSEGLGIKRVISPTFILMRSYEIPKVKRFSNFYHIDLYRLEGNIEDEVKNIGLFDIWKKKGNIVFVEWAEKLEGLLPEDAYKMKFEIIGETERKITINKNEQEG